MSSLEQEFLERVEKHKGVLFKISKMYMDEPEDQNELFQEITYQLWKAYPSFEEKLTHLVFSITKNHGFYDGNKRTAIIAGAFFLELNAFDQFFIDIFIQNMENIVLLTAQGLIDKNQLQKIISDLIYNGKLSEETQMIYVELLGKIDTKE